LDPLPQRTQLPAPQASAGRHLPGLADTVSPHDQLAASCVVGNDARFAVDLSEQQRVALVEVREAQAALPAFRVVTAVRLRAAPLQRLGKNAIEPGRVGRIALDARQVDAARSSSKFLGVIATTRAKRQQLPGKQQSL
jgi:hypothetical protein